jgi:sodium transport system permease protein
VFVTGKWLAASVGSMMSVFLTTALSLAMLDYIPLQELGIRFRMGPEMVVGILAAVFPICFLAPAMQAYASTFARSFKEAQSYMGLLIMVPMLPGMLSTLYPLGEKPWLHPVPLIGQQVLLTTVLSGRPVDVSSFVVGAVTTIGLAIVLVRMTTVLFHKEKIIFSR